MGYIINFAHKEEKPEKMRDVLRRPCLISLARLTVHGKMKEAKTMMAHCAGER